MKKFTRISFFIIFLLLVNFTTAGFVQAVGSPTPTIDYVKNTVIGTNDIFMVSGATVENSEVLVYIDRTFIGFAAIAKDASSRFIYKYRLNSELTTGSHTVMIIGRDKTSLVLSPPSQEMEFNFQLLPIPPAPTILIPNGQNIISKNRPTITGLTKSGTQIMLFIDGVSVMQTKILENNSGTANFFYRPVNDLGFGRHILTALAIDKYGQKSATSSEMVFKIEKPLPAPVLLKVLNSHELTRPYITGLAKNDLTVKVFIDNKIDGSFTVKNNQSGTANFSYQIRRPLTNGGHSVYTLAIDKRGKASGQSNTLKFVVNTENIDAINIAEPIAAPVIVEGIDNDAVNEPDKQEPTADESPEAIEPETKNEEPEIIKTEEKDVIDDLIKNATTTKNANTGIVDESNAQQSKIKLNLVVFILFLMAVIAWIFWVNRELIKEKNAKEESNADQNKDKPTENKV